MPFTFSHPAAILPFKRLCPRWLNLPALILGSMAPDVPYFFLRQNLGHAAHTLPGSIKIALPIGFVLLCAFYLLHKPLCYLLPMPHRGALFPKTTKLPQLKPFFIVSVLASILIGVWTHNFWDAFTHVGGYFAVRLSILQRVVLQHDKMALHGYTVVKLISSVVGLALIAFTYWRWLISQPRPATPANETDGWRYSLVGSLVVISFIVAIPFAAYLGSRFSGYGAVKIFVVREAVCALTFFVPAITLAAIFFYLKKGGAGENL